MIRRFASTITLALVAFSPLTASIGAQGLLWGNAAGSSVRIHAYDKTSGALVRDFAGVGGNGRGVVVVGDVVYYTVVGENLIHKMSALTGADLGSITTSTASLSTLAWDGSTFWTTDYAGSNQGFQIALDGTTLKTITFGNATGYMDGMEYFNGKLIVNRYDGGYGGVNSYDVYDLNGNLLQSAFIQSLNGTGIAFDGTDFYVADVFNAAINVYDGTTGMFKSTVSAPASLYNEDLSVDYETRIDTSTAPEPASLALFATGLLGVIGAGWQKRRHG